MTNRLDDSEAPASTKPMMPGEVRTFNGFDRSGQIVKTVEVRRTNRPYVYDLCDAYNKAMRSDAKRTGARYEVNHAGELQLTFPRKFSEDLTLELDANRERERRDWQHRQRYPVTDQREAAE